MIYKKYCRQFGLQTYDQWFKRKFIKGQFQEILKRHKSKSKQRKQRKSKTVQQNPIKHLFGSSDLNDNDFDTIKEQFPGIGPNNQITLSKTNFTIQWRSLKTIKLFNGLQADDIYQGQSLNDCYFLAAASAIAKYKPKIIQNIFASRLNGQDEYTIKLIIGGQNKEIVVKNSAPYFKNQPLFAKEKNQSWAILLQKAYAKALGGYQNIDWGNLNEGFFALTGCHAQVYEMNKNKKLDPNSWSKLLEAAQNKLPIMAAPIVLPPQKLKILHQHQVHVKHVYAIIEVNERQKTIQLRDSYGKKDPLPPIIQLDKNTKDGVFRMTFKNFQQYFTFFSVARVIDDAKCTTKTIKDKIIGNIIVNTDKSGTYSVAISTLLFRSFGLKDNKPRLRLIQLRENIKIQRDTDCLSGEFQLNFGNNQFYFQNTNKKWPTNQTILNFSVYGLGKVQIQVRNN